MIDTNRLKGLIVQNNLTQEKMAKMLGMTPKTFGCKIKKGVFLSNEMDDMITILKIDDPAKIFFARKGTQ